MRKEQIFDSFYQAGACPLISGEEIVDEIKRPSLEGNFDKEYAGLLEKGFWPEPIVDETDNTLKLAFSRVACLNCKQCVPSRIDLSTYLPTAHQKDLISNSGLSFTFPDEINENEHLELALRYRGHYFKNSSQFHTINDWAFRIANGKVMEARDRDNKLMGTCIFYRFDQAGIGDQYYYAPERPDEMKRMSFILLSQLFLHLKEQAETTHLYLGNWSLHPTGLSPKARHSGLEILDNGAWRSLSEQEKRSHLSEYFKAFPSHMPV